MTDSPTLQPTLDWTRDFSAFLDANGLPDDAERVRGVAALLEASPAVAERERLREDAAEAGWNACRKSIYAVCEDVQEEAASIEGETGPAERYKAGARWAAKSIARGFCAMNARDDDNLRAALAPEGGTA